MLARGNPVTRTAKAADVPGMEGCVEAAYRHYIERMGCKPGPMVDDYARVVADEDVFVVEENEEIVAILVMRRQPAALLLDNLAVVPALQGRRVGRRLIERAESFARQLGYHAIQLYTHETMRENLTMYARLGYVEIERRVEAGYRRVYMRKTLAG